jgi:hypothetical protein
MSRWANFLVLAPLGSTILEPNLKKIEKKKSGSSLILPLKSFVFANEQLT